MFSTTDTIVAIATAPGRGGIGVVRLGGPASVRIAQALTGRADAFEPRHASLTRIVDPGAQTRDGSMGHLDEVVVTWFQAPHSYTGDDVVEISGHGSPVVLQRIVELAMQAGARLAEPGEFTLRAYLNGRLDLAQAEAVADLVDAVTPLQARAAMDQLEGTLTGAITRIDSSLFDLAARLEASLDFPDEGFHFVTRDDARRELTRIRSALGELEVEGRAGRVIREGRIVAIIGPPNAGKSSLFNALVGSARAIVTPVPGTTRDLLTERVDIGGLAVTLVDTAGLREAADVIEAEGVARAEQTRRIAALTLVLLDGSVAQSTADWRIVCETPEPKIVVWNKSDLPHFSMPEPDRRAGEPSSDRSRTAVAIDTEIAVSDIAVPEFTVSVGVSAITGHGLPELKASVQRLLAGRDEWRDTPAISNLRHLDLVERAGLALDRAIGALGAGATEELALDDIGTAREALEAITGRRTPDDVLRHIFSKFCVGK